MKFLTHRESIIESASFLLFQLVITILFAVLPLNYKPGFESLRWVLLLAWNGVGFYFIYLILLGQSKRETSTTEVVPAAVTTENVMTEATAALTVEEVKTAALLATVQKAEQITPAIFNEIEAENAQEEINEEADDAKEAKAFETVKIYDQAKLETKEFYQRLTATEQKEFKGYFIDQGDAHLVASLHYEIGAANEDFFRYVFNYIYRYRKNISLSLLMKLHDELVSLAKGDATTITKIHEGALRVLYSRRREQAFLAKAEALCRDDIQLHVSLKTKGYVYSMKRLAIILEKTGRLDEAIALCDQALSLGLLDQTRTEYSGRKARLLRKKLALEAKTKGLIREVAPVVETVTEETEEADEGEADDALENEKITITATARSFQTFYSSLTKPLQAEFDRLFVTEGPDHVVKTLVYNKAEGADNHAFFETVFTGIYRYRRLISFELLTRLHEELVRLQSGKPTQITLLNDLMIRTLFYRRKNPIFLDRCEELSREDIALNLNVLKARGKFIYSYKRLAILLERTNRLDEAIELCQRAIRLQLTDQTKGGYAGRLARLQKRLANAPVKVA